MIKIRNHFEQGSSLEELKKQTDKEGVEILDISEGMGTIEVRGGRRDIDDMIEMFDEFEIKEVARTGTVALERGSKKTT